MIVFRVHASFRFEALELRVEGFEGSGNPAGLTPRASLWFTWTPKVGQTIAQKP